MTKTDIMNALPNIHKTWEIAHERACAFINGIKEIYSKYDTEHIYSVLGSNYVVSDYLRTLDGNRVYLYLFNDGFKPVGFTYGEEGKNFARIIKVAYYDFITMLLDKTNCKCFCECFGKYDIPYIREHLIQFADSLELSNDEIDNLMKKEHIFERLVSGLNDLSALVARKEKNADEKFFKAFGSSNNTYKNFRVKVIVE